MQIHKTTQNSPCSTAGAILYKNISLVYIPKTLTILLAFKLLI